MSPRSTRKVKPDSARPLAQPTPAVADDDVVVTGGGAGASPRLLDRMREAIRVRHYSIRTEAAYVDWARRFILFHDRRHPMDLGPDEVAAFLTDLAVQRNVAASIQNQAKSALLFLYKVVLGMDLPWLEEIVSAKNPRRLPVVLTPSEVRALLHELSGTMGLIASLLYGTGVRLLEGLRLRVKDVEFERPEIVVRDGEGGKDRVTVLRENLVLSLSEHVTRRRALHNRDLDEGKGEDWLPDALAVKYPSAEQAWGWQWIFASSTLSVDPRSGVVPGLPRPLPAPDWCVVGGLPGVQARAHGVHRDLAAEAASARSVRSMRMNSSLS